MTRCLQICLFFIATILVSGSVIAQPTLVLNNTNLPPYTTPDGSGYTDMIAHEAFRRVGVKLMLIRQPPERGLQNADAGMIDGDLTRIQNMQRLYPNLLPVGETLMIWHFSAFSRDPELLQSSESIKAHSVGYVKGWKIYEKMMQGGRAITEVDSGEHLMRLLDRGRIKTALFEQWIAEDVFRNLGIDKEKFHAAEIDTREMYIYLNKKHAALIPRLEKALREMKAEGFYQKAYKLKLEPYMNGVNTRAE